LACAKKIICHLGMDLIFASNNKHKISEIQAIMPPQFRITSLIEAGIDIDIPEPHQTLEENALEKARTIYRMTSQSCFSEDTGLEVFNLNGEPGVQSARYAGEERSSAKNIQKLLDRLSEAKDRSAQFRAVICLIMQGQEYYFEGIAGGKIIEAPRGNEGFGYDPVFIPDGSDKTFAEMSMAEKNRYNHRRKAADRLVAFLNQYC
jgi:XTP/dITP diphosphohydrolase